MSVVVTVCVVAMCAYIVARYNFKLKTVLILMISASLMLPAQAISQPLFSMFKALGIYDTKIGLIIVYAAMGIPMSFFVIFYQPKEVLFILRHREYNKQTDKTVPVTMRICYSYRIYKDL